MSCGENRWSRAVPPADGRVHTLPKPFYLALEKVLEDVRPQCICSDGELKASGLLLSGPQSSSLMVLGCSLWSLQPSGAEPRTALPTHCTLQQHPNVTCSFCLQVCYGHCSCRAVEMPLALEPAAYQHHSPKRTKARLRSRVQELKPSQPHHFHSWVLIVHLQVLLGCGCGKNINPSQFQSPCGSHNPPAALEV